MLEPRQGEFLTVHGTNVHLLSAGEGEPLLWLHGMGSAASWSPVHDRLARHYRVLAPDHPGFGFSDAPDWLDGIDDLVYFYLDFLDQLGIERAHVVGHGVGGWIAAELGVGHSNRFGSLVLIAAAGLHVEGVAQPEIFSMLPAELAEFLVYDKEAARARLAAIGPGEAAVYDKGRSALTRLGWDPYLHNPKLTGRLRRIRVPTLVIWGEQDPLLPVEHAHVYAREIPDAALSLLPRCGHCVLRERPDALLDSLIPFLHLEDD
jgi:pimeloyl-ACP methyl ester carboxylesterase